MCSIENPLLFQWYIDRNDLGKLHGGVPTLFGLYMWDCPTKDSYILWSALCYVSLHEREICQPWAYPP